MGPTHGGSAGRADVIDCCVHHHWATQAELTEYISPGWREYLVTALPQWDRRGEIPLLAQVNPGDASPYGPYSNPFGDKRQDSYPADGPPGSSYELLEAQLLADDRLAAVLLAHDAGALVMAAPNHHLAAEVARAINDWTVDRWLDDRDERVLGTVLLPTQQPDVAAAELRRAAAHPRMVAATMAANGLGKPFGHPVYHPIYEAANDVGLPILIRAGANATPEQPAETAAGGPPATYAEYHALAGQSVMTHVVTLIAQGVFEKYKDLKVLVAGCGVTWIPPLLSRFDTDYRGLRRDAPWMRRLPSAYFTDHVRVCTYPLEPAPPTDRLRSYLSAVDGLDQVLCYASGYPNWDCDSAANVLDRLPAAWRRSVAYENASALLGRPEG